MLDAALMRDSAVVTLPQDFWVKPMRTTLNIDADVLMAAKELARRERKTVGECFSELVREALHHRSAKHSDRAERDVFGFGFRAIPAGRAVVSNTLVDELREDLGI